MTIIICRHLELEIALAILAPNDEKQSGEKMAA